MGQGPAGSVRGRPLKNRLLYIRGEVLQSEPSASPWKVSLTFYFIRRQKRGGGEVTECFTYFTTIPPFCLSLVPSFICRRARVSTRMCQDSIFNLLAVLSAPLQGFSISTHQFRVLVNERVQARRNRRYSASVDRTVQPIRSGQFRATRAKEH